MENKKSLLVISHSADLAGAELALLDTLDAIVDDINMLPHFILPREGKLREAVASRKWPITLIPYDVWAQPGKLERTEDIFRVHTINSNAVLEIAEVIDGIKPAMVLTNSLVAPWGAFAAALRNTPHVWFVHEYGDMDHGLIFEEEMDKILSDVDRLSDLVIANSKAIEHHLSSHIDPSKIVTAYIPYDFNKLEARASEELVNPVFDDEGIKVVMVGRITKSKGQLDAVRAVGELNGAGENVQLCLIGAVDDAAYMAKITDYIDTHNLSEKIHHVDFTYNPFPYVKSADIGLNCSSLEAYGRVTFEYAALAKPVLGVNTGGTPEIIINGQTGFLYEHGESSYLAANIKKYIESPELIKEHGTAGAAHARQMMNGDYSVSVLAERLKHAASSEIGERKLPFYVENMLLFSKVAVQFNHEHLQMGLRLAIKRRLKQTVAWRAAKKAKEIIKKEN